jgi:hypothetical protein
MFRKTPSLKQSHLYAVIANYDVIAKRQKNLVCFVKAPSLKQSRHCETTEQFPLLKETFFAEAISSYVFQPGLLQETRRGLSDGLSIGSCAFLNSLALITGLNYFYSAN